jgi:hypothetical protein
MAKMPALSHVIIMEEKEQDEHVSLDKIEGNG